MDIVQQGAQTLAAVRAHTQAAGEPGEATARDPHSPDGSPAPSQPTGQDLRAPRPATARARELLVRTVELPGSTKELLTVLGEYRAALVTLVTSE